MSITPVSAFVSSVQLLTCINIFNHEIEIASIRKTMISDFKLSSKHCLVKNNFWDLLFSYSWTVPELESCHIDGNLAWFRKAWWVYLCSSSSSSLCTLRNLDCICSDLYETTKRVSIKTCDRKEFIQLCWKKIILD